jgi:hypothetical protein
MAHSGISIKPPGCFAKTGSSMSPNPNLEVLATDVEVQRALQGIGLSEEEAVRASATAAAASGDSIERFVHAVSALLAPLYRGLTAAGPEPLPTSQPAPIGEPALSRQPGPGHDQGP